MASHDYHDVPFTIHDSPFILIGVKKGHLEILRAVLQFDFF